MPVATSEIIFSPKFGKFSVLPLAMASAIGSGVNLITAIATLDYLGQ